MYYLCSESKGADQLLGYREADLRLCFRICKKLVFSRRGSYIVFGFVMQWLIFISRRILRYRGLKKAR